jgi:hypothetical protein
MTVFGILTSRRAGGVAFARSVSEPYLVGVSGFEGDDPTSPARRTALSGENRCFKTAALVPSTDADVAIGMAASPAATPATILPDRAAEASFPLDLQHFVGRGPFGVVTSAVSPFGAMRARNQARDRNLAVAHVDSRSPTILY